MTNLLERARACGDIPDEILWQLIEAAFWIGHDAKLGDDDGDLFVVPGKRVASLDDAFERLSNYLAKMEVST